MLFFFPGKQRTGTLISFSGPVCPSRPLSESHTLGTADLMLNFLMSLTLRTRQDLSATVSLPQCRDSMQEEPDQQRLPFRAHSTQSALLYVSYILSYLIFGASFVLGRARYPYLVNENKQPIRTECPVLPIFHYYDFCDYFYFIVVKKKARTFIT